MNQETGYEQLEAQIVSSALWAAAGDAVGWITELAGSQATVRRRSGREYIDQPVAWTKTIGGLSGPRVKFEAGTYSDDTQLRLATARSIRSSGEFDPETFAKIELPVWTAYALGAGRGTKAAAGNLSRRNVNWFSNFFDVKAARYVMSGGNGASMRIQPHVWSASETTPVVRIVRDVLRNSLITHGHPHGFLGAIFHAVALHDALFAGMILPPEHWGRYVEWFGKVEEIVNSDPELSSFWLLAWEAEYGASIADAVRTTRDEVMNDIDDLASMAGHLKDLDLASAYNEVLVALKCNLPQYRGSGIKTALAASALSWLSRGSSIEDALLVAANNIDGDTDTIATMAGAIRGADRTHELHWPLQDRDFIVNDAARLAAIGRGDVAPTFVYPDLAGWQAPSSQLDVVGRLDGGFAIAGLGAVAPVSEEFGGQDAVWQWMRLLTGQTVLIKRRVSVTKQTSGAQLPDIRFTGATKHKRAESSADKNNSSQSRSEDSRSAPDLLPSKAENLDSWTEAVVSANFSDEVIGRYFNRCLDVTGSIEKAVAFAGIVAKAKLIRSRKRS
jgi:ADP-ribosylglycohydrolase